MAITKQEVAAGNTNARLDRAGGAGEDEARRRIEAEARSRDMETGGSSWWELMRGGSD
jgi:hypothetical protein